MKVFEQTSLQVQVGGPFTAAHFQRLVQYNERRGNRYFAVGHNRIYFKQYVGVIQVGNLTIEILPKADAKPETPTEKEKWQGALIEMLRRSGFIRVESLTDARLRLLRSDSLLDLYFESFLAEVDRLAHHGFVRKYRRVCGNLSSLKGRIIFPRHLARNLVHREHFFTAHEHYDRNNIFNQIIRRALDVLTRVSTNPHLTAAARGLEIHLEDVDQVPVSERTFTRLSFSRNTEHYRTAIQLARLIILNYSPDICGGREDVLAILFDMNRLFERFIYAELKRAESAHKDAKITFRSQVPRRFWFSENMQKFIRPDIIAQIGSPPDCEAVIMDTKWKIPSDGRPSDSDLHQMHAYNVQFGAQRSVLLYPRVSANRDIEGTFAKADPPLDAFAHSCAMVFVELFDGIRIRRDLGEELIMRLTGTSEERAMKKRWQKSDDSPPCNHGRVTDDSGLGFWLGRR
jgi:5-methylcytosine-specific restriction enzyme subunit McrC